MPVSDSADCFNKLVDCERREIIQSRYNLNHALYIHVQAGMDAVDGGAC